MMNISVYSAMLGEMKSLLFMLANQPRFFFFFSKLFIYLPPHNKVGSSAWENLFFHCGTDDIGPSGQVLPREMYWLSDPLG